MKETTKEHDKRISHAFLVGLKTAIYTFLFGLVIIITAIVTILVYYG